MIIVFLSGKLITLDTILPLLHDLRCRRPGQRFEFICFDSHTEQVIQENVVLFDVLQSMGSLKMIGRRRSGRLYWVWHRIYSIGVFTRLVFLTLLPATRLIHFKALNDNPFRILYSIAAKRTLYVQSTPINHSETERHVDRLNRPRNYSTEPPAAGRLLGFSRDWDAFRHPALSELPRHDCPPPYQLASWHDQLRRVGDRYFSDMFPGDSAPKRIGVMVLSSLDRAPILQDPDGFAELFRETLTVLFAAQPDLAIVVKPHPATRANYREIVTRIIGTRRQAGQRIVESHLHPLMLAQRARFFVGNMFSTTFANAKAAGVPTIEFTRYGPQTLEATQGGSMRPDLVDHFIQGDRDQLIEVVGAICNRDTCGAPDASDLISEHPEIARLFAYLAPGPSTNIAARSPTVGAGSAEPAKVNR